jgi:glycosyltransferase involved in cell wall biosynthesis
MPRPQVARAMGEARVLVLPSICYEGMPMTILEAYASGLPVIASGMGGMSEIVKHGKTGFTFPPGDTAALSELLRSALDEPHDWDGLRRNARCEYEQHYTPATNLKRLVEIYEELLHG